jgi:hypothetical protein
MPIGIADDHVLRDRLPAVPAPSGPIPAIADVFFRVDAVGFVAAESARLRGFLRAEPLAEFRRDLGVLSVVPRESGKA